ncbi:HAD-IC family P-type ATPase [Wenjunlia tyrosinilytica]|uniref:Haloacid dehalogenase n=1 Tax=Wenjunlia tyrosinilytica TaxID=1544741 RepID=A0A918DUC1_9ACTN|nr:HAD-IC family P-type ATPase [Wenjunlia tyrosinilytica]GGO82650.1 haloacid dehalogenase [Wenjunlia tyrosinilytica]
MGLSMPGVNGTAASLGWPRLGRLLDTVAEQARGVADSPVDSAASALSGLLDAVVSVVDTARRAGEKAAEAVPRAWGDITDAVTETAGRRRRRRLWARAGRAHVEVRGLTGRGRRHRAVAQSLVESVRDIEGIHWAEVNAVLGQMVISFDEGQVDVDGLLEVVQAVEEAHGVDTEPFSAQAPWTPFDTVPATLAAVSLATDCVGIAVAAAWRYLPVPPLPRALRAPLVLAQTQPRARRILRERLGAPHADMLLALASAVVHAATAGAAAMGVDAVQRAMQLSEIRSAQEAWRQREGDLAADASQLPREAAKPVPRPAPFPAGPVETCADRTAAATLLGAAGVLAWTLSPARAAEALLATVPKAAELGREAFTCVLLRDLARRGAVPMRPDALRLLDRISAVVIVSTALCTPRPRVLSALATADLDDAEVWGVAHTLLADRDLSEFTGAGPWTAGGWRLKHARDTERPGQADDALVLDLFDERGRRQGRVRVGSVLDPLADALIGAARSGAERVLITENASTSVLRPLVDEVLPGGDALSRRIRRLQADGHGVLLVTDRDGDALRTADVGVAVLPRRASAPHHWFADLVCGPGLEQPWRLLSAIGPAHRVSAHSARMSTGASVLGALLTSRGDGRSAGERASSPVNAAAALALVSGVLTAHGVARAPLPPGRVRDAWHALGAREVLTMVRPPPDEARAPRSTEGAGRTRALRAVAAVAATAAESGWPPAAALAGPVRLAAAFVRAVREELRDPLTPVLAVGAAASAVVGSTADSLLVGGVMVGNALISGGQRLSAGRALSGLLLQEQLTARRVTWAPGPEADGDLTGLRAARPRSTPAQELRPGDIVALRTSDVVPADARLLVADDLEMDEASLTGESAPVAKDPRPTPGADLAERACMVYQGCTVLAGSGSAVVVATGADTEAGRAAEIAGPARAPVGIEGHLARLSKVVLPATGLGGGAVTLLALLRGQVLRTALASGVAIAVAAVPEGLPLVATVAQSAAARRLSRRSVLVRTPRVLEALGRVDTVCFDKTGTLTEGRLSVVRVASVHGPTALDSPFGRRLLRAAARSSPDTNGPGAKRMVHATDRAVVDAASRLAGDDGSWRATDELPFVESRGYAASFGTDSDGPYLAVKGAPEIVLEHCATALDPGGDRTLPLDPARRRKAETQVRRLADEGLRVLAVAEARRKSVETAGDTPLADLTLLGFVAIADTVRAGAEQTVAALAGSGVAVVMITGDHPATAAAIARDLGIQGADAVVTGTELETLTEKARIERVTGTTVFARVSPEQKVRIVRDLQRSGRVVAMVGDGINDAAAIRASDVGIGMAARGSTSARSASDLVLTEPDPRHILDALREGRALWGSVRDAVAILVGGNAGEVAFTVLGTALAGHAPLSTRQLLLVNLLTDMLPALAVAVAPARPPGSGQEPPAPGPGESPLRRDTARVLAVRGASTTVGALAAWQVGRMTGRGARAGTMGLAALVGTQLGQTLVAGRHSGAVVATSAASAAVLFALVQTPGVSHFFGCVPLGPVAWAVVLTSATGATLAAALAPPVLFPRTASPPPPEAEADGG